jgi:beta-N-acetylhexosaminidase
VSRKLLVLCAVVVVALASLARTTARPPAVEAQTANDAFVDRVIASLTPDERIGQLVMVNFVGADVSATSDVASLIRDFKVGSVLVTASNGNIINRDDTPGQVAALTNGLQQRSFEATRRSDTDGSEYFLPLLIATDDEGDLYPLSNVTHNVTAIPNNMTIGATWSKAHAQATGAIVGKELSAAGINMLLGPVVDVLDNPRSGGNGDIGIRSFGGNAAWVGALGRAYVAGVHTGSNGRMLTVTKHFPGHGGSDRGTDNEVPTINKSLDQLRALELAPFAQIDTEDPADPGATTDAMMVSHIRYRNFVPGTGAAFTGPISLDSAALTTLMNLPEFSKWRASHMVMSDALGVQAVKKWYASQGQPDFPNRSVVHDALMSGSDLLPLVEFYHDPAHAGWKDNQLPVMQDSLQYMREQYAGNAEFRRRADDAVRHVIAAKIKLYPTLQLAQVTVDPAAASAVAGGAGDEMRSLAEDALTLLQPQTAADLRQRLPRAPQTPDKVLIVECWSDCYATRVLPKNALQDELLALYGPAGKARVRPEDVSTVSFGDIDAWLAKPADTANSSVAKAVADASWIVLALTEYNPNSYPASAAARHLLDSTAVDLRNKNVVAIAYNVPYHLDSTEISKLAAYFAVYNKTEAAITASMRALFGDLTPKGHSPVNVSGTYYNVAEATQPDPAQTLKVGLFGVQPDAVPEGRAVPFVAGPLLDRNGAPVPDGTIVSFALTKAGGATSIVTAKTVDGMAGALAQLSGVGSYGVTASVGALSSPVLAMEVVAVGSPTVVSEPSPEPVAESPNSGGGSDNLLLALAIGLPGALAFAVAAGGGVWFMRRRRFAAAPAVVAPPPEPAIPAALRVDLDTRRVYVRGNETRPALSNEQFRLLSYLYERAGKVVPREELVLYVWPDAHAEGVSEEALDALVRRVRERIVQAGGERSYIATLRGQGFRLDL